MSEPEIVVGTPVGKGHDCFTKAAQTSLIAIPITFDMRSPVGVGLEKLGDLFPVACIPVQFRLSPTTTHAVRVSARSYQHL